MGFQEDHVCLKHNLLPIYVSKCSISGQRPEFFFLIKIVWFGVLFLTVTCDSHDTNSYVSFAEILHIACGGMGLQ